MALSPYALYMCEDETVIFDGLTAELGFGVLEYAECKNTVIKDCTLDVKNNFAADTDAVSLSVDNSSIKAKNNFFSSTENITAIDISNSTVDLENYAFCEVSKNSFDEEFN